MAHLQAPSGATIRWQTSHSRLSLDRLTNAAQAIDDLATQPSDDPDLPADAGAVLRREAELLRAMVDDLSHHLRREALLAAISNRLLNTPLDEVEEGIVAALAELGTISQVQRAYVFLLSNDGSHLADAYEWVAPGVEGHDFDAFRGTPVTAFPWSMEQFQRGDTVFVYDPDALPAEAAPERGACELLNIRSYVNMPLFVAGTLIGWLGFDSVTDEHIWSEEEMRFMVIAADTLVNAIERKRREELLFRQRELSQRINSVGTLAAGLAHEINNPLSYVIGNLTYIRDVIEETSGRLGEEELGDVKEAVAQAHEGADRVGRIIGDMRALAFGEQTEIGAVDLRAALDATLRMTSNQLRHRATVTRAYDHAPAVLANASRLGQVLINLVLNAAQAIPDGRVGDHSVTVAAEEDGEEVRIRVQDTGAGIPAQVLPRVFDPFFTTREVGEGMGMGLSICYRLVKSMNGTIDIASDPGKGTTVTVRLPRAGGVDATAAAADRTPAEQPQRRILLVDDEPMVLDMLARVLKGNQLVRARNGREALAELDARPDFDVVFCDLMMPDMTGQDVYEHLRTHHPGLEQRLVFISGGTFTREMARFLDRVPNTKLRKPFDTKSVRAVLEELPPGPAAVPA
ncbi:ATP-binding protein [Haliangium sp.]|uniref:sensor histidine kinase n=1 Tax=Haliangium sp. TaxID=2663208 RepID=UPI003D0BBF24